LKWPRVLAVLVIVVVGAVVGWLAAMYFAGPAVPLQRVEVPIPPIERKLRAAKPPPPMRIAIQPARPPAVRPRTAELPANSIAAKPVRTAPPKIVDSYPLKLSYLLSKWSARKAPSGFLDGARLDDRVLKTGGAAISVARDKVITLSGWAGDQSVGVRYPYVLISACGRVVAHVVVNLARPEVANSVHGNLGRSGWRAQIALRHLPDCGDLKLRVWGVAPGDSKLILPLDGQLSLVVAPAVESNALVTSAAPPLRPTDMKPLTPVWLRVMTNVLNIRRCAGVDCAIVGRLAQGEWTVLTLDDMNGWLLFATPEYAGWVSKRYVGLSPLPG
jgi:hypothetical protein